MHPTAALLALRGCVAVKGRLEHALSGYRVLAHMEHMAQCLYLDLAPPYIGKATLPDRYELIAWDEIPIAKLESVSKQILEEFLSHL